MRTIPKVDRVLAFSAIQRALNEHPRPVVLDAIRSILEELRKTAVAGRLPSPVPEDILSERVIARLRLSATPSLKKVVNGTGVVIQTNLGRSPLAKEACNRLAAVAEGYSNLEFDLESGERGERYSHVERLLCELTGAEAALAVNNNAAAVLLTLTALAYGREVVISRGELVEIGGSFRIPDVMQQSGAILKEIGATNRTHLKDYRKAVSPDTALLMKVHASNFAVIGFTKEVSASDLVQVGREQGIPVVADLGSGSIIDLGAIIGCHEPTIREYLRAGVDVVTCSGDKLLGGPQAGIIVGRKDLIATLKRHPLLRALRIDKLTLAALEATLRIYKDERRALTEIPTLRMLTTGAEELKKRGRTLIRRLKSVITTKIKLSLIDGNSLVGGGALPTLELPTALIAVESEGRSPQEIDAAFRGLAVPVVGRINKGRYLLDLRTIDESDLPAIKEALSCIDK